MNHPIMFLDRDNKTKLVSASFSYFLEVYEKIVNLAKKSGTLRKMCPNTELFLVHIFLYLEIYSVNFRIQSEYRKIRTRNNSVFGHFSRSGSYNRYNLSAL